MTFRNLKYTLALALVALLASPAFAQKPGKGGGGGGGGGTSGPTYTWIWLGTLGGTESMAGKLNNNGDIAGSAQLPDGTWNSFLRFSDGGGALIDFDQYLFDLGLLAPYNPATETGVVDVNISDLNDAREVVGGYAVVANASVQRFAFYLALEPVDENGAPMPLQLITFDIEEFDTNIGSLDINNFGLVAGATQLAASSPFESYVWTPAHGMQFLGVTGVPRGINSAGVICGYYGKKGWKYVPGTGLVSYCRKLCLA